MADGSPTALDRMQSAVQLAAFHYIACMKARPSNDDHQVTIGSSNYAFNNIAATPSNILHLDFQQWAVRVVLRDLIENFSLYLIELYRASVLAGTRGSAPISADQFERRGLEDQLTAFAAHFGVDEAWIARLVGFNRARNCLAHRQGLVSERDITEGRSLVVRWLAASASLMPAKADMSAMDNLIQGRQISGQPAFLSIRDKEKCFEVGSFLHLAPDDFLEICQTFHLAAAAFFQRQE